MAMKTLKQGIVATAGAGVILLSSLFTMKAEAKNDNKALAVNTPQVENTIGVAETDVPTTTEFNNAGDPAPDPTAEDLAKAHSADTTAVGVYIAIGNDSYAQFTNEQIENYWQKNVFDKYEINGKVFIKRVYQGGEHAKNTNSIFVPYVGENAFWGILKKGDLKTTIPIVASTQKGFDNRRARKALADAKAEASLRNEVP